MGANGFLVEVLWTVPQALLDLHGQLYFADGVVVRPPSNGVDDHLPCQLDPVPCLEVDSEGPHGPATFRSDHLAFSRLAHQGLNHRVMGRIDEALNAEDILSHRARKAALAAPDGRPWPALVVQCPNGHKGGGSDKALNCWRRKDQSRNCSWLSMSAFWAVKPRSNNSLSNSVINRRMNRMKCRHPHPHFPTIVSCPESILSGLRLPRLGHLTNQAPQCAWRMVVEPR
ncbi:uncharacterized protein P884DRAFT_263588 [Thermothelomyces heterothallicus CBS 202.75]|uniref:uncharacterized protein n=1 Tax=Thermothelomyces heterothallicus CBS 202.75 TaxID=1149848 RepID=UPI0037423011